MPSSVVAARSDPARSPPAACAVLIVGGGMAGLELAHQLASAGVEDVVVAEAGPADDLRHAHAALDADRALESWLRPARDPHFDRPWRPLSPPHYAGASGLRRRLGGRSLYWYGTVLPIEPWALGAPWPPEVAAALDRGWRGGASLYARVLDDLARWKGGAPGSLALAAQPRHVVAGRPFARTPQAVLATGGGRWRAYSPLDHWRDPSDPAHVLAPGGVTVVSGTQVMDVTVRRGAVTGVRARRRDGGSVSIASRCVVLAAGAIEGARLALACGGLDAGRMLPITDHLVSGILLRLPRDAAMAVLGSGPARGCVSSLPGQRSNLFVEWTEASDRTVCINLHAVGEQERGDGSRIELDRDGRVGVRAAPSAADLAVLGGQQAEIGSMVAVLGRELGLRLPAPRFAPYGMADAGADAMLRDLPVATPVAWTNELGTEDHEGCCMPLGSVLDEEGEAPRARGLFAAGPAVMPRMGAANPTLTTLALARRLASIITDRL